MLRHHRQHFSTPRLKHHRVNFLEHFENNGITQRLETEIKAFQNEKKARRSEKDEASAELHISTQLAS